MIKQKENLVRKILTETHSTRDHDNKLISSYWHIELRNQGVAIKQVSAHQLLVYIWEGKLSSAESITRCRRKIQELTPELRGEKWNLRHKECQEEVKSDLREMETA